VEVEALVQSRELLEAETQGSLKKTGLLLTELTDEQEGATRALGHAQLAWRYALEGFEMGRGITLSTEQAEHHFQQAGGHPVGRGWLTAARVLLECEAGACDSAQRSLKEEAPEGLELHEREALLTALGRAEARAGRTAESLQLLEAALKLHETSRTQALIGWSHVRQRDFARAAPHFERALALQADQPSAVVGAAAAALMQDPPDLSRAAGLLQRFLEMDDFTGGSRHLALAHGLQALLLASAPAQPDAELTRALTALKWSPDTASRQASEDRAELTARQLDTTLPELSMLSVLRKARSRCEAAAPEGLGASPRSAWLQPLVEEALARCRQRR
jgi:tetratricopeptide (TPR) repeat protein